MACAGLLLTVPASRAGTQATTKATRPTLASEGALAAFVDRVEAYVALRTRVEAKLPKFEETRDPVKLTARQRALAAAVIAARSGAKAGDIFGEAAPLITRILRDDFSRRSRADRRALVQDVPAGTRVDANAEYPDGLPVVTIPPGLLRRLPVLPDDLEYRIVGRDLVLLDTTAGLVSDVLRGAVPV